MNGPSLIVISRDISLRLEKERVKWHGKQDREKKKLIKWPTLYCLQESRGGGNKGKGFYSLYTRAKINMQSNGQR